MSDNPLISIVVPVYKVEKFLVRCVNSIMSQSYRNIEIILVDDGSPDNCPQMCDNLKQEDDRIVVIHQKNGGISAARNAGLGVAKGDYLFFVDSDDWLNDEYVIEKFYRTAKDKSADFVYGLINSATDNKAEPIKPKNKYRGNDRLFFLSNPYSFSAWNKLYGRNLLQYIHFAPERINEDVDIVPIVFSKSANPVCLYEHTYNYYNNMESITREGFNERRFDMFKSVKHCTENFVGTEEEKDVFLQNMYGFQLFSVYIEILKQGNSKLYTDKFFSLQDEYEFDDFFKYALQCFWNVEEGFKKIKKILVLLLLRMKYINFKRK